MKESMTQLKKRETKVEEKKEEKQLEKVEPTNVLSSLLDSDLLENISEDDDILDKAYLSLFSNLRGSLPKLSSRLPSISELSNRVKRLLNHEATQVSRE